MFAWLKKNNISTSITPLAPVHIPLIKDGVAYKDKGDSYLSKGEFELAAHNFKQAIAINPAFAEAYNNLGNALRELGNFHDAELAFQQAISIKPDLVYAYFNLASMQMEHNRLDDAAFNFSKSFEIKPDFFEAMSSFADILLKQGKYVEAIQCYEKFLSVIPDSALTFYNLGVAYKHCHDLAKAIDCYQNAITLNPSFAEAYCNMGNILFEQKKLTDSMNCYRKTLEINPGYYNAYYGLGILLEEQNKLDEALDCYRKVISLQPDHADAYGNLGNILVTHGKLDEAICSYQKALELQPLSVSSWVNLGNIFKGKGILEEALACYQKALEFEPGLVEAHINLGNVLKDQGHLDAAIDSYQKALILNPESAEAYNNMGGIFKERGNLNAAIDYFRKALLLKPDDAVIHSNLLLALQYSASIDFPDIFSEHLRFAERFEEPLKKHWQPHLNIRDPDRKIKVGYVSGDFRNHAVAYFIEPLLAHHDKSKIEIFCYYNHTLHDTHTKRIAAHSNHWIPCSGMSDESLAERIRTDEIDILVDLSGHTAHNRLLVFARKPAPLQASWIGYVGSTGLTAMDFRITDSYMDPHGITEQFHTEKLVRLSDTSVIYSPDTDCPPVNQLPALTSNELVFASLNSLSKVNQPTIDLWGQILYALPHARLMLANVKDNETRQRLLEMFCQAGITTERLTLQPRMSSFDYMKMHQNIDIALDPFPYNGGATTLHSLWMGVPVITLAGNHMVSRYGVSLMSRVGLEEFITYSKEEYLQRAIQLAHNLSDLNHIRQSLRSRMSAPSNNPENITRKFEAAYRDMWKAWCILCTNNT
jgi:predicted O-linked N-acetylglucosamine transferase (SPINDLY family)